MARAPLTRSLSSLVLHSQATAADSGGGTMCAHRSFLGAACAKTGARPVARMPARPVLVCNTLRRVIGAVNLLIVMRFPPRCTSFLPSLPTARRLSTCMVHTVPEDCHGARDAFVMHELLAAQSKRCC